MFKWLFDLFGLGKSLSEQNKQVYKEAYHEINNAFQFKCDLCRGRSSCVCGSTENLTCHWRRSDHLKCPSCARIQFPVFSGINNTHPKLAKEWAYVYYNCVTDKGVKEYVKRRDKLLKRIEKEWRK